MAKRARSKKVAGVALADLSVSVLLREVAKRQGKAAALRRRRDALARRIERIEAQIRGLGGDVGKRGPGRPRGSGSGARRQAGGLAAALHQMLQGRVMGVTEAAQEVVKAGYKTGAANFRTIVNAALIKHKHLFKKKGRGKYTAA